MNRRDFLKATGAACILSGKCGNGSTAEDSNGTVMSVLGAISPEEMGVTLAHEHVLVDFIGAEKVSRDRYDEDEAFEVVLPYLERVKKLGCRTFVGCTPAYIGRDPVLLKRLHLAGDN